MRLGVGLGVLIAVGVGLGTGLSALAGTKGGVYDFSYFLSQPHPFAAAPAGAAAPTYTTGYSPSYSPATAASEIPMRRRIAAPPPASPPPPAYRPSAQRTAAATTTRSASAGDPYRDASDGWFDRLYVSANVAALLVEDIDGTVGGSSYGIEYDVGYGVDLALGTYFTREFRGELAFTYRTSESDSTNIAGVGGGSVDLTTYSIMANGYYDFFLDWEIHPFVGVGLDFVDGDSFTTGGLTVAGKDGTEFGYQLIAGFAWEFSPTMVVTLDYRYHASSDDDLFFHTLQGGLRYNF